MEMEQAVTEFHGPVVWGLWAEKLTALGVTGSLARQFFAGLAQRRVGLVRIILLAVEQGALTRAGLLAAIADPDLVVIEELERFVRRYDARRRRMAEVSTSLVPASAGEVRDLAGRLFGGALSGRPVTTTSGLDPDDGDGR
jgi:hypothetical protein